MTQEALKLARQLLWRYRHEIPIGHQPYMICHQVDEAFERIDEALAQPEHKCNSHPKAPHGFNRNASHANDRYTCECESWDAYEAGYQAGVTAGIEMSTETEQKPVAWLGFNERGECREVFTPKMKETFPNYPTADMIPVYTTPPQEQQSCDKRTWVGLTDEEIEEVWEQVESSDFLDCVHPLAQAIEAKLKQKNGFAEEKNNPPQLEERNFCSRCGKRTKDIHTCTPPHE